MSRIGDSSKEEFTYIERPCPTCGSEGKFIATYVDAKSDKYGLPQIPVPLRKCNNCGLRFFDLVQDVNVGGEIYEKMDLSTNRIKPRHFGFAKIINKYWHRSNGLELGAGHCHIGRMLSDNHKVIAMDKYYENMHYVNNINFLSGNLMDIPDSTFPADSFDWIIADNTLEHLPAYHSIIANSNVWLKSHGVFFVSVPNGNTIKQFIGSKNRDEVYRPIEHVNIFDNHSLDSAFEMNGFKSCRMFFWPNTLHEMVMLMSMNGVSPFGLYRAYTKS